MSNSIPLVHLCAVCGKPTTRLLGFMAAVSLFDAPPGKGLTKMHMKVLGGCRAHHDQLQGLFDAECAAQGETTWTSPPTALRPNQVARWHHVATDAWAQSLAEIAPGATYIPVRSPEELPKDCPHCSAPIDWDSGPHVQDALERGNAFAWQCSGCRAAGLLTLS